MRRRFRKICSNFARIRNQIQRDSTLTRIQVIAIYIQ